MAWNRFSPSSRAVTKHHSSVEGIDMFCKSLVTCILIFATFTTVHARKWKDITGDFTVEAELIKVEDDVVHLRRESGAVIKVPIAKLSEFPE